MKPRAIYYIAAALALALTVAVCDGLRTRDKYSVVVGQLQESVKVKDAVIAEKDKVIEAAAAQLVELDKKLCTSEQVISGLNGKIAGKDADLAALRESWAGLSAECQTKLHELDTKWAEKFTLLESVVAEKDAQIVSWQGKFDVQVQISDAWKAKFEAEARVSKLAQEGLKLADRKLKTTRIVGNVTKVALIGLGGYVLINKLTGK